jgi:drug/metabolite transporter (DMT)-like permease
MNDSKIAGFCLLIVAALWGLTFPLIGDSMATQDPFLFVSLRFSLAAIFVIPYFLRYLTRQTLIVGSILGVIQSAVFISQTVGLETTDPSRAAFLTGINILLVPFLSPLLKMGYPTKHDVVSGLICCIGIFILTECDIGQICKGDIWILSSAVLIGLSIVYIGQQSKNDMDPFMLSYAQIVMTALFSWVPTLLFSDMDFIPFQTSQALVSLFICSIFATIVAITLQAKYQKYVSLQSAALIFSLEPVFAAVFDIVLRGATPKIYTLIGGVVILFSMAYLELWKPKLVTDSPQQ